MRSISAIGLCILLLSLATSLPAHGQKEGNIWYFGNEAGIDFNSGAPVALTNSAMDAYEGCASISDAQGNLLFYTDGIFVYDRNHAQMPNGAGLMGHPSSSQSGVIVPKPGNPSIYYIFTVPELGHPNGFRYSVVDMSMNGGLGDVTTKNILLLAPAAEKVTAVKHQNQVDFWVIVHGWQTNTFNAYLVTAAGISTTAVTSNAGMINGSAGCNSARGYLKASSDGTMIALAMPYCQVWASQDGLFEVFSFDKNTGIVSSPFFTDTVSWAYGIEFSPDNRLVYVSCWYSGGLIYQYDLSSGSQATVMASKTVIADITPVFSLGCFGAIQLAPDGKIYVAKQDVPFLGVINNPNVIGIGCNYVDNSFSLLTKSCRLGLPTFIQSFFFRSFTWTDSCFTASTCFSLSDTTGLASVQWDFDDPPSGAGNTSYDLYPCHVFSAPGTYDVSVVLNHSNHCDTFTREVHIHPLPIVNLGPDTNLCNGDRITFGPFSPSASYLWHDGSTKTSFTSATPGLFWVEADLNGCHASDSVVVGFYDCEGKITIHNIFTPNGDGVNEVFYIEDLDELPIKELVIFNRWGNKVYESLNYQNDWDAKGISDGVYYYVLRISNPVMDKQFHGTVTILR